MTPEQQFDDVCLVSCQPCVKCGQHVPKTRTVPLCMACGYGLPMTLTPVAQGDEGLRRVLLDHHPIAHTMTGPLKGCRCGEVGIGQDVIAHVADHVRRALLDGDRAHGHRIPVDGRR